MLQTRNVFLMMGDIQALKIKTTFVEDSEIDLRAVSENKKDMIPAVIADAYCREILHCIDLVPKSAIEINSITHIPISTIYRRIQTMCNTGLVKTSGSISEDGKKCFLYKSTIKEISMKFDGSLEITVIHNRSE